MVSAIQKNEKFILWSLCGGAFGEIKSVLYIISCKKLSEIITDDHYEQPLMHLKWAPKQK